MWRTYLTIRLGKCIAVLAIIVVAGCSSVPQVTRSSLIPIPKMPKSVVTDSGQVDKNKFPDTIWIKPPVVDNEKGRAYWSFDDVDKINKNLTEWPAWGKDVKELIEGHNKLVGGEGQKEKGSWRPW
jgi:hypothetical protein